MRRLWIGLVLATGCAKDVTHDFEQLADRACACADQANKAEAKTCGKAVLADLVKFGESAHNVKGDQTKTAAAARRIGECLLRSGVTSLEIATAVNHLENPPEPAAPEPAAPEAAAPEAAAPTPAAPTP